MGPKYSCVRRGHRAAGFSFALLVAALSAGAATAADMQIAARDQDLTQMSLEDLMSLEVTGVSRRAEPLGTTPAAVFVLTAEDIRRAGATHIAEALRLVPGLDVARINAQSYAVSARGFNASSADKLEVLIDGRSAYTPLTSAVFWDVLDTYLPDIERIEVIRGPGGSVWGANAVNGVINIVTKSAVDTQGEEVFVGAGTEDRLLAAFRAGGAFGADGHVRVYAKTTERDSSKFADGSDGPDGQVLRQAGTRMDWGATDRFTVSGDVYQGHSDDANGRTDVRGGNALARWSRSWGDAGESAVQLYYDSYDRDIPAIYSEQRRTYDLDAQFAFAALGAHELTAGLGARVSQDETGGPPLLVIFQPSDRTLRTYSAFVQDQIRFGQDRGSVLIGSKVEHNDFTGTEFQPGIRAGWRFNDDWYGWSSVSRAVRTPNRLDHDIAVFCDPAFATALNCTAGTTIAIGSRDFDSEKLIAYEAGLRVQPAASLLLELALFYNDYQELRGSEGSGINIRYVNEFDAVGSGGELNASWTVNDALTLRAFYSYLNLDLTPTAGATDTTTEPTTEGNSPEHQLGLSGAWRPAAAWNLDAQLRYVSRLHAPPSTGASVQMDVPAYVSLDLRAGWQVTPQLSLALLGRNLLDSQHPEFGFTATRLEIERAALAELRWYWN